ncbi:MAG TPA: amino acid adenylation domain-containing protein [Candidatus Saccharimonadales bacterium]|nr:amino acid adenylation domain-containing protein [Candidatus Saccharimonadales bacterium]
MIARNAPPLTQAEGPKQRQLPVDALPEEKTRRTEPALLAPRSQQSNIPLSFSQQRLWFLDQLAPGTPVYNVPEAIRLTGALSVSALEQSFNEIIRRHEALRTTFPALDGHPVQVIAPSFAFKIARTDLSHLDGEAQENEVKKLVLAEAKKPFDLTRDLMVRVGLLHIHPEEHVLLVTMHHIASDAWSIGILYQELSTFYKAFTEGKAQAEVATLLPELPVQYPDFAIWQRDWLEGPVMEEQLAYWKKHLAGAPDLLELPTDKPRPPVQGFKGSNRTLLLPTDLQRNLKQLSRREGVTLFMTLLAAFKVLLSRYSRQTDILVGSPIAGRTQVETEGIIGFFVNTLVLRTDLGGNPTFRQLLKKIRQITLDAYSHQDLPLEKIVMELKPERSSSHTPLFQVMFALQNAPGQPPQLGELRASFLTVDTGTAKFDLLLSVTDTPQGLHAGFEYNCDLFEESTIERMLQHFHTLLNGIISRPDSPLCELPIVPEAEKKLLLQDWSKAVSEYPREKTVHQVFEEHALRNPEAVALVDGAATLTYKQLNERANQLAHHLINLGVQPDTGIGFYLDRSIELVVAMLAILKAGSAYVPLDRTYPRERLKFMIEDADLKIIITRSALRSSLPETNGAFLCLDIEAEKIVKMSRENPKSAARAGNYAYVIYTSGSTGKPKGACIPHRGINRLVLNTNYARLEATDVFTQISNVSFDAATWEIWGALLNGARLVIVDKDTALAPTRLAEEIRNRGVTQLFLTVALFNQMARENPKGLDNIRYIYFGGEAADPKSVQEVLREAPNSRLINAYGPTEATTYALCYEIKEADGVRSIPIGKPISNTDIYILDEFRQPVPIGVPGELYIGGDGLAVGYLHRPDLTSERFVPHPFSADPQARLYRTGDLVRYLASGDVEFLGRIDHQVKIRGFRIELGEIESVLSQHSGVKQCTVIAREDGQSKEKRIVAYCVVDEAKLPKIGKLRDYLVEKLPDYMVPGFFVQLKELPLTPNGKVNRAALPAPENAVAEKNEKLVTPRNATQEKLAELWENVLGVRPVGLQDSFFELGGHSLLAVQLVSQIEKSFGKKLSVSTIFQYRTVEQLSRLLREEEIAPLKSNSIVEIQPKGTKPPLVFVHGVGGGMFWGYTNLSHCLGPDQPVFAIKSRGMDGEKEYATMEEMASHYVADLRAMQPEGPYYLGGYCFGGIVAYEMAQQLLAQGQKIGILALINCGPPNSSYAHFHWSPVLMAKFLKNLMFWAGNTLRWKPEQRREFLQWKWRVVKRRWASLWGKKQSNDKKSEVENFVDLSAYPAEQQRLWQTHIMALMKYKPQPYPGHITLLRSKGHQLLCSFDDRYGWGEFAMNGVTVRVVSCPHEGILEEPHVAKVAEHLKDLLKVCAPPKNSSSPNGIEGVAPQASSPTEGRTMHIPLSHAQERFWAATGTSADSPVHHLSKALRLRGPLSVPVLEEGFSKIMHRHEALRTSFLTSEGQTIQVLAPEIQFGLTQIDLTHLPAGERDLELNRSIQASAQKPFELEKSALFRANLFRLQPEEHVIQVTVHGLVGDTRSLDIIYEELSAFYEAKVKNVDKAGVAVLPMQYPDYARAQKAQLSSESLQQQLAYWKNHLAGKPDLLELPTDRPRPAVKGLEAKRFGFRVGEDLLAKIASFSREQNSSLELFVIVTFQALLSRYTDQREILVGVRLPNRSSEQTKHLVGCLDQEIPLCARFEDEPSFSELLQRQNSELQQGEANQYGFGLLLKSQNCHLQSHHPIYQTAVHFQEPQSLCWTNAPCVVKAPTLSRLDLVLVAQKDDSGMELELVYSEELFDEATIVRMSGHFIKLLESITAEPGKKVSRLDILPDEEKRKLLVDWNATQSGCSRHQAIHELFEEQVRRTPNAPALAFGRSSLTYEELNNAANALARRLVDAGAGPDVPVGICMARCTEMIVSILAILKAGSAYVPMDPNYPAERLGMILEDSKTPLLVTQHQLRNLLPAHQAKAIYVESLEQTSGLKAANLDTKVSPSNLAYIIYTSGSTGRPKGVALEHRSVVTLAHWAKTIYSQEELSGVLAGTSVCFDLSVFEIFVPLSWGGQIILAENSLELPRVSAYWEVTLVNTVPSAMAELVRMNGLPTSAKVVNLAGEPLENSLVRQIYELGTVKKVYDLYGPTEDTVYSTFALRTSDGPQTIGRPVADTQIYLLDRHLQPVPIGVPGELHIGGHGLARGYYLQPEMTAKKFIPNPFDSTPDSRLYKTGDLARYRPDGTIQFLGRIDNQVKVRGFRIELGDIENALRSSPLVQETVVMAREDNPGEKQIVAYVVQNQSASSPEVEHQQVNDWHEVWDQTYAQPETEADATFNLVGWTSSYTGESVSSEEMKEWVEATVQRIQSLKPERILEIGCGTGLLLFRLSQECKEYCGSDFSGAVIKNLQEHVARQNGHLKHVSLRQAEAADFTGIEVGRFDTIIINSVAQYFPDVDYFLKVLEQAVRVLKPGGAIFIGDIRNYLLLEPFLASVAIHTAPNALPSESLKEQVVKALQEEQELTLDPKFFKALKHHLPKITDVEIQLKRGRAQNEVTRFRYDVVLRLGEAPAPISAVTLDWKDDELNLLRLHETLVAAPTSAVYVKNIPNARISSDIALAQLLSIPTCPPTVESLRLAIQNGVDGKAIDPEEFWTMGKDLPFEVQVEWANDLACYNVFFVSKRASAGRRMRPAEEPGVFQAWSAYANNPIRNASTRKSVPQLRQWLKAKLPEYMIPAAFVLLPALPLLPNGKVNRKALPVPEKVQTDLEETYVAPCTTTEEVLANLWSEVLGISRVGTQDNFFELGGHSLMATQVLSRLREKIQIDLPLRTFFEAPTIASLALEVEGMLASEINEMSEEEAQMLDQGIELSSKD